MALEAEARNALFARPQLSAKGLMGTQGKHSDDQDNYKSLGTSLLSANKKGKGFNNIISQGVQT